MIHPGGEQCDSLLCEGVRDCTAWDVPIFECAVSETAPSQYVCPAHERMPICHVFGYGWEIRDAFVRCIQDVVEFYPEAPCSNVVGHHRDDSWVAVVNLRLLLVACSPSTANVGTPLVVLATIGVPIVALA